MSLKNYGVLKGKAIDSREGMGASPHFQVLVIDDDLRHRIAINVKSKVEPSELLYYVDENFDHPMVTELESLPPGFHELPSESGGMALDYIRGNCFDVTLAKPLPHDIPGPDNDLNELIHKYVARAIAMENSAVYAFGEKWGPETKRDKYFGFKPGNGIHDIHVNQGNSDAWKMDDGIYQDGGSSSTCQTRRDGSPSFSRSSPSASTRTTPQDTGSLRHAMAGAAHNPSRQWMNQSMPGTMMCASLPRS